ncbi:MAG: hypothetical protein C0P74_008045 [Gammaproteobacteria bacterium]
MDEVVTARSGARPARIEIKWLEMSSIVDDITSLLTMAQVAKTELQSS